MRFYSENLISLLSRAVDWYARSVIRKKLNNRNINFGKGLIIDKYFSLELPEFQFSLTIEDGVVFRKFCNIVMLQNARLTIGKNVFFNNYCSVNCLQEVFIGENTLFGEGVKLYDHNHVYNYLNEKLTVERKEFKKGFIKIGKNCWIGSNVTILKDVEIGDNVIIGANSLIYKSIPADSIVRSQTSLLIEALNVR